jgi:hypothetical protein
MCFSGVCPGQRREKKNDKVLNDEESWWGRGRLACEGLDLKIETPPPLLHPSRERQRPQMLMQAQINS